MKKYTLKDLCNLIDHTNLKANINYNDLKTLCNEAKKYNFKMVAINPAQIETCCDLLKDSKVGIGAAIAFPLGQTTLESKIFETKDSIEKGATEIDYVINISEVKNKNYKYIDKEMKNIVNICREKDVISKVIFEISYLENSEIIELCKIASKNKPDFIKTSTGFSSSGATVEAVKLMRENVVDDVKVKAAGGIRTSEKFKQMIEAGAERIGTSSGVKIIEEIKKEFKDYNYIQL